MNINDSGSLVAQMLLVAYAAPITVVLWTLFRRAKKPGWLALVPFYNLYLMGEIAKRRNLGIACSLALFSLFLALLSNLLLDSTLLFIALIAILALYLTLFMSFVKKYDKSNRKWLIVPFVPLLGLLYLFSARKSKSTK